MKRVVADANVLVSAALARSPSAPSALVLLAEVAGVLTRPRLARYLSGPEARRFVAGLGSQTTLTSDAPLPHPAVCRDPGDDYLVALAVHARAEAIVTGDRDLLELAGPPVPAITPRVLIERLRS